MANYLKGFPGPFQCDGKGFATADAPPQFLELATLHDILHTFGIVGTCAPNEHLSGHVDDNPNDLMWARQRQLDSGWVGGGRPRRRRRRLLRHGPHRLPRPRDQRLPHRHAAA